MAIDSIEKMPLVEKAIVSSLLSGINLTQEVSDFSGQTESRGNKDRSEASAELGPELLPDNGFVTADRAVIIRITSSNPNRLRMTTQKFKIDSNWTQVELIAKIQSKLKRTNMEYRGAYKKLSGAKRKTRFDLDVSGVAGKKSNCLLIFHCESNRTFFMSAKNPVEGETAPFAIFGDRSNRDGADDPINVIDQAHYVKVEEQKTGPLKGENAAKTVMALCRNVKISDGFKYGIGLRVVERGKQDFVTSILIDPKIKND